MADSIQHYISSGVLEAYVMGSLSALEEQEVVAMKQRFPAVNQALARIEDDIEAMAMGMAIIPPPVLWNRVEESINELVQTQEAEIVPFRRAGERATDGRQGNDPHFIEVEAQSEYIKVHRLWRWAFAAVFVLGKIFLATAIYFYIENRHNQQQVQELKAQVQQLQHVAK
ncbi:hypothetical protein [Mucilaginibacter sp.]